MATQIGKQELAEAGDPSHPWNGKGYQVKPAIDRGPDDSGCPFETDKPIPHIIYEGGGYMKGKDGPKWPERTYLVDEEAIALIRERNLVPGGRATKETINLDMLAALHQAKQAQAPVSSPTPPTPLPRTAQSAQVEAQVAGRPSLSTAVELAALQTRSMRELSDVVVPTQTSSFPAQAQVPAKEPMFIPELEQAMKEITRLPPPPKPRFPVRFKGRFGTLQAPYNQVFRDGIALVLVQNSPDGVYYEPPYDPEELMEIALTGQLRYLCHSGVHYKMPDGLSAHTVYLIDRELTGEEEK